MPCQTLACSHLAENKMLLATRAVARRSRVWPITTSLVEFGHPAHCTPAVGRIHHFKNCRAVCATRGPSAGAVDITPSTRRYCGADGGADPSTCRRKDLREVQIGGAGAAKEGAFGTVSRAKIMGYSNPKANARLPRPRQSPRFALGGYALSSRKREGCLCAPASAPPLPAEA